jgi:hypothetical protein
MDSVLSSACRLCRRRNKPPDDGLVRLDLESEKDAARAGFGFVYYCVDCYEELRNRAAKDGFDGFPPFYEYTYELAVTFTIPLWLITNRRDAMHQWRKDVDVEGWKKKLQEEAEGQ